jgi:hypothetical protein
MSLLSAIPTVAMTVGAAVAIELRRVSEVQVAVAEQRSADATARAAARQRNAA